MKLREFLQINSCPFCNSTLKLYFHPRRWQSIRYEDNRLLLIFRMNGRSKKEQNYKVGYSFDLDDNSWYIDFFMMEDVRFNNTVPNYLRTRFRNLDANLPKYRFYKSCLKCSRYECATNFFTLNFKTCKVDLHLAHEYFGLIQSLDKGLYRICKLSNNYTVNQSSITYYRSETAVWARSDCGLRMNNDIQVPGIIKFSSNDETMNRINKLIVFS